MPTQSVLRLLWRCPAGPARRWWSSALIRRWLFRHQASKGASHMTAVTFDPVKATEDFNRHLKLKTLTTIWFLAILSACAYALLATRNEWWLYEKLNIASPETEK